jgi:hypothetical protein
MRKSRLLAIAFGDGVKNAGCGAFTVCPLKHSLETSKFNRVRINAEEPLKRFTLGRGYNFAFLVNSHMITV